MTAAVESKLHGFAAALLESRGALVDWPAAERQGTAMLPAEVAAAVGVGAEVLPISCEAAGEGLAVNLAGDFLQWAGCLLDAVPRVGTFSAPDLYLKRKGIDEAIAHAFTWLNAKVKLCECRETTVEYHTWWFHGSLNSEDRWETCFCLSVNSASLLEVEIPDPLGLWELKPRRRASLEAPSSYERAAELARRHLLRLSAAFLDRMDDRLGRDRKRLNDYYRALLGESANKKTRGNSQPDPEKQEAKRRAVDLELCRKLAELDERYAMTATLRPVVLVRTELPVIAVDLSVFRKQARKTHTIYWNPLLKQFEPLRCNGCGEGVFAAAFTNDEVEPLCQKCAK